MIAPDGTPGWIPHDQVSAALKAGGKIGVSILAPDQSVRAIPLENAHAALNAGAQLIGALPSSVPPALTGQASQQTVSVPAMGGGPPIKMDIGPGEDPDEFQRAYQTGVEHGAEVGAGLVGGAAASPYVVAVAQTPIGRKVIEKGLEGAGPGWRLASL